MENEGIDAVVEKITSDPEFAKRAYADPERTLDGFGLRAGEWRLVSWFLRQDVADSLGDVEGKDVATLDFSSVRFDFLSRLPGFRKDVIANPSDPTTH